jgi:23S rRNA pseudouridine1911/1915/1917 synthase
MNLDVLFEDNHCLAVNKPAGLPSQGDESGAETLVDVVTRYLKTRYHKPGNVYVGLLHRLDRPTSGALLLAKTSKAAGRLSAQFRAGTISKVYWAIVEGGPLEDEGEWIDRLEKERSGNRVRAVAEGISTGKMARVHFRVRDRGIDWTHLELCPKTGRSHQLRVQSALRGFPIVGDLKYGATTRIQAWDGGARIALHARELTFNHPIRGEPVVIEAPVPEDWPELSRGRSAPGSASSKPGAAPGR